MGYYHGWGIYEKDTCSVCGRIMEVGKDLEIDKNEVVHASVICVNRDCPNWEIPIKDATIGKFGKD